MSDLELRQKILAELEADPNIEAARIGVAVDKGVVILTGHVCSYPEQLAVIQAVGRVEGVGAIAQEIEFRPPRQAPIHDDEIAARAMDVVRWDPSLPSGAVRICVRDGWITLTGDVNWKYQRDEAERAVRKLAGVAGIRNQIRITPHAPASYIRQQIEDAFKRNAELEAEAIRITVQDEGQVLIEGKVRDGKQRDAVERAVLSIPGIKSIEDRLVVAQSNHPMEVAAQ